MKKWFFILVSSVFLMLQASGQVYISASKAEYFEVPDTDIKECNGLYPVKITFSSSSSNFDKILVLFSSSSEDNFEKIYETSQHITENTFYHINKTAKPGQKYFYKIQTIKDDAIVEESSVDSGWGALPPDIYFMLYNKIITISHNKLVLMNKKKTLEKLGSETISGKLSGTLAYKTAVKGLGGLVTMDYSDYSDKPDWIINGSMNTKANLSANGTMYGTIEITGMYPGKIFYDNVVISDGKAGGGTYDVQPSGYNLIQLDYHITFKNIDELY